MSSAVGCWGRPVLIFLNVQRASGIDASENLFEVCAFYTKKKEKQRTGVRFLACVHSGLSSSPKVVVKRETTWYLSNLNAAIATWHQL